MTESIEIKTIQFFSVTDCDKKTEDKLSKATRDCSKASIELIHGLMAQITKDKLFNTVGTNKK